MDMENILSAAAGSALSGALAWAFISRSLRSLDDAVTKIGDIRTDLARITVRLDSFDKLHDLIHTLDRKVAALETKGNGKQRNSNGISRDPS